MRIYINRKNETKKEAPRRTLPFRSLVLCDVYALLRSVSQST